MKVVCFDFDDVLTDKSALSHFLGVFGHTFKELKFAVELLEDNKHPKKFFRTVKKLIGLGKGVKYERIEKIVNFLHPNKNARQTLKNLKERGCKVVVVSVNDENIIKKFLKKHDMDEYVDHVYAGKMGVKGGLLTGEISGDVIRTEKTGVVRQIENLYRVSKNDITYVGDGLTDLPIMKKVGYGILFCPNPITNAQVLADKELAKMKDSGRLFLVEEKDLSRILEFI